MLHGTVWIAVVGCAGTSPAPSPAEGTTRDTLVIGDKSDFGTLMSILPQTWADSALTELLGIAPFESDFDCAIQPRPGLATSWSWNDDGTVLTMTLRDDLTWEDGVPVTAEDVAFTYELVADPAVGSQYISYVEHMAPDARPKVIDATHLEWHFTQSYDRTTQAAHVDLVPLPRHVWADADRATLRGHALTRRPLAYGPWRLASWEPSQQVVLEPNAAFTGPASFRPRLQRVIYRVIPEYATRLLELEGGTIDLMKDIAVADADRLRTTHPEIRLVRRGWRSMEFIVWNLQDPRFQDPRVRRALAMATDVNGMIGKLLTASTGEAYGRPSIGTITPALCAVHDEDIEPLPYDVAAARALLASAGWRDSDADGVLDKEGRRLAFTLTATLGNKRRADASVLFQDLMKQIGVAVELDKLEVNTFFANLRERRYEAALAGWTAALFVDPSPMWACDTPEARNETNFAGYCNADVDALIQKGLSTADARDAAPIWKEMQRLVYEDQPYLFLWWMDEIVGINDRFENTTIDMVSPYKSLYAWEVPEGKVKYR
jgi:peptide/nickel transport system substrate-binding protein